MLHPFQINDGAKKLRNLNKAKQKLQVLETRKTENGRSTGQVMMEEVTDLIYEMILAFLFLF